MTTAVATKWKNQQNIKNFDKICEQIISSCSEAKAQDIVVLDLEGVSDVAKYYVIVTGRSDRQCQGISNRVEADMQKSGASCYGVAGYQDGHWIIMDYVDTVLHVFYEDDREKYDLEGLWNKAKRTEIHDDEVPLLKAA